MDSNKLEKLKDCCMYNKKIQHLFIEKEENRETSHDCSVSYSLDITRKSAQLFIELVIILRKKI